MKGINGKLIRLSKAEKAYLIKSGECKYHRDLHTTSKGNNTYATENERVLRLLSEFYGREYKVSK